MINYEWMPTVLSNTGCQFRFYPLLAFDVNEAPDLSQTLWDEVDTFRARHAELIADETVANLRDKLKRDAKKQRWDSWGNCAFVKMRLAVKNFRNPGEQATYEVLGVELSIETTAPGDRFNECGFLLNTQTVLDSARHAPPFQSVYQQTPDGIYFPPIEQDACHFEVGENPPLIGIDIRIGFRARIIANGALGAHIVIDIGNTRTGALFLKDEPTGMVNEVDAIRSCCTPVMLDLPTKTDAVTKADIANVDNGIVSSWIMLHQTEFDEDEPSVLQRKYIQKTVKKFFGLKTDTFNDREEQRIPTMFVRYSPVVLGKEATNFLKTNSVTGLIEQGLQIQQSSPKRYFAERKKTNLAWSMIPNAWTKIDKIRANKLRSDLLYWMNEAGGFVDPDRTEAFLRPLREPSMPNYPRSATFVWMLVGILERAWDQCNRLTDANGAFTPYAIHDVIVTYPSGWTRDEIAIYRQRCSEAVRIFERTNFSSYDQIKLDMSVDEAVASQLPFVFSEIHKFGDNAQGWLKFAGKKREDGLFTFRIMNFDIGGGTTDISVVEYGCLETREEGVVDLQPKLLFRDGYSEAGDELLRQIIDRIVFPAIEKADSTAGEAIRRYFTGRVAKATEQEKRSKDLKLNIVPLAIKIMRDLASGAPCGRFMPRNAGVGESSWYDELYMHLGIPEISKAEWCAVEIDYDVTVVNRLIREFFENAFASAARIASLHDIDLFFMSGKTSEIPELQELAKKYIPVTNDRIVAAKNYCAGDWYPFVKTDENGNVVDNTVKDAKSITAVGAALNFMLANQKIQGWKIEKTVFAAECDSQWGFQDSFMKPNGKPFAFDDKNETTVVLDVHKIIARRMTQDTFPSAVYRLQPRDPNAQVPTIKFLARVRRGRDESTKAEYLDLVSLTKEGESIDYVSQYELAVCQGDELFWQDSGCVVS